MPAALKGDSWACAEPAIDKTNAAVSSDFMAISPALDGAPAVRGTVSAGVTILQNRTSSVTKAPSRRTRRNPPSSCLRGEQAIELRKALEVRHGELRRNCEHEAADRDQCEHTKPRLLGAVLDRSNRAGGLLVDILNRRQQ